MREQVRGQGAAGAGLALALLLLAGGARRAEAADKLTPAACIKANEEAGPLRKAGKTREARANLRLCSSDACPGAVRRDCIAGAAQADADVPTIVFSVQDPSGSDLVDVKISLDGQPLVEKLDGKAIEVDPGEHGFRFEAVGQPPVEKRLVIIEGEKNRRERVLIGVPVAVVAPPPPVVVVPPPVVTPVDHRRRNGLIVGGLGLGLLAGGAASGLVAALEWSSAKDACGATFPSGCKDPRTASSDRSATLVASTVADVALGLGGVAVLTGAAFILLAPPPSSGSTSARLTLQPELGPSTGGVLLQGSF